MFLSVHLETSYGVGCNLFHKQHTDYCSDLHDCGDYCSRAIFELATYDSGNECCHHDILGRKSTTSCKWPQCCSVSVSKGRHWQESVYFCLVSEHVEANHGRSSGSRGRDRGSRYRLAGRGRHRRRRRAGHLLVRAAQEERRHSRGEEADHRVSKLRKVSFSPLFLVAKKERKNPPPPNKKKQKPDKCVLFLYGAFRAKLKRTPVLRAVLSIGHGHPLSLRQTIGGNWQNSTKQLQSETRWFVARKHCLVFTSFWKLSRWTRALWSGVCVIVVIAPNLHPPPPPVFALSLYAVSACTCSHANVALLQTNFAEKRKLRS